MTLLSTTLLNAIAIGIKVLSMLALNKLLAVIVGPAGYALIGQLQNFVTSTTTLANAGVTTGITKYTAEYHADTDADSRREIWRAGAWIAVAGSVLLGLPIALFAEPISVAILHSAEFAPTFYWFPPCLLLFAINSQLVAILNGLKLIRKFVAASIGASLAGLVFTAAMGWTFALKGVLIAVIANQSLACLITLALCRRDGWFRPGDFFGRTSLGPFRKLSHYSLMAIATSVVGPMALIFIRGRLVQDFGADAAGHWEAVNRISSLYLMFLTTPLSVYYLPRLAELSKSREIRGEMRRGYVLLIPAAALLAGMIYLLRDLLIGLLFTSSFAPMRELFGWQLAGDVLRVGAWLLSFFLLSKSLTVPFIVSECAFNLLLVLATPLLTSTFGLAGAPMAYTLCYGVYCVAIGTLVHRILSD